MSTKLDDIKNQAPPRARLTTGSVSRGLLGLTMPMILGISASIIANIIETWFLGQVGTLELAAYSFTFPITGALTSLSLGMPIVPIKELMRKRFIKRVGIEPVIGHLKSDHRLGRNYLKGFEGDQINVLMAAAAFNFRKWMRLFLFALKITSFWGRMAGFNVKLFYQSVPLMVN